MQEILNIINNNIILRTVLDFILTFIVIFVTEYFLIVRKSLKYNDKTTSEINLILLNFKIDIHKINYKKLLYVVALYVSFLLSLIITVCFNLLEGNRALQILVSVALAVPLGIFGFDAIGGYFEKHQDYIDEKYIEKQEKKKYYIEKAKKEQNKKNNKGKNNKTSKNSKNKKNK